MMVKQISVFLENKPGKLKELTDVLRENNINMRALSVADAQDFGIVRLIVDDVYNASTVYLLRRMLWRLSCRISREVWQMC